MIGRATGAQTDHAKVLGAARVGLAMEGVRELHPGGHARRVPQGGPGVPPAPWRLAPLARRGAGRQDVEEVVQDGGPAHGLGGQEGALAEQRHLHAVHRDLRVLLALTQGTHTHTVIHHTHTHTHTNGTSSL